jgi:hypothetical protein
MSAVVPLSFCVIRQLNKLIYFDLIVKVILPSIALAECLNVLSISFISAH